jgi:hypothetical protein
LAVLVTLNFREKFKSWAFGGKPHTPFVSWVPGDDFRSTDVFQGRRCASVELGFLTERITCVADR